MDGGWIENDVIHNQMTILGCFIHSFHAWFWCLTVFAWGAHYLNKNSASLAYLNQGVYPFYIVHMPLTFAGLSISKEFGFTGIQAVLLSGVFVTAGCWMIFEAVRRTVVTIVVWYQEHQTKTISIPRYRPIVICRNCLRFEVN